MARHLNLLILILSTWAAAAATGSWNGVAFSALNGVAQTAWNGTSISCAGGAPTYVRNQNFEGTGYDNSETWTETAGAPDEDYTGVVLRGSQSCEFTGADSITNSLPASTNYWMAFRCRFTTTNTSEYICSFRNGTVNLGRIYSDDTGIIQAYFGTDAGTAGTTAKEPNTTFVIWVYCLASGGANGTMRVWMGTGTTRPAGVETEETLGAQTGMIDNIIFDCDTGGAFVIDQVIIDDEEFTTIPN